MHYLHVRGRGPAPLPIVLTHGWPSSFTEFLKIITMLTDPVAYGGDRHDSFDVVVLSIPGFGFSSRPLSRGFIPTYPLWTRLMERLGYSSFIAQGGDFGAGITTRMARFHPNVLHGICLLSIADCTSEMELVFPPKRNASKWPISLWDETEAAYERLQSTKPQTISYGPKDSPASLAACNVEKFRTWSDCGGDIKTRFSKDELLNNIMIYWATQTVASSMRYYYEVSKHVPPLEQGERIETPLAAFLFPTDLVPPPPRSGLNARTICRNIA